MGGGGPGVCLLPGGVEGRERVLFVEVSSSSSDAEAASSHESAVGILVAFGFVGGERERFFRDKSRPGGRLEEEISGSMVEKNAFGFVGSGRHCCWCRGSSAKTDEPDSGRQRSEQHDTVYDVDTEVLERRFVEFRQV